MDRQPSTNSQPPSPEETAKTVHDDSRERGEEFVRLLMEHESSVRMFLRGLLPTWNDVDEVIQEASLVAWRKFDDFELGTAFGGWLLTIARFEAMSYRRRISRSPLVFSDEVWEVLAQESVPPDTADNYQQHLETCLQKMPTEHREVLLRVHSPGAVIRDVAVQSGRSEQAFYKVIQRLRSSLLDCVSKNMALEEEGC
ncbi:RNA polymerase subunit sigma-70 [Rubripirellula amarantea]|uniref:RNA polymerase sigma factor n=1 Tax=Rubripirellula amarantea TaxID=2527999 RepID=A0A5C5WXH8_9BACT|nr:sigma factor [Rubripirellula amarantea]MDA8746525.1 RNA polymerase subunit sigma-70 [Rubripirellula amarantea]TWT54572.1 RNA polymerase sigma factor [Rubripirellula amarantea]